MPYHPYMFVMAFTAAFCYVSMFKFKCGPALKQPMLSSTVQFITCDIMIKWLTEETAYFLQDFTPDVDLRGSFYFSSINCAVSSVNHSVRSVLIKCRTQLYISQPQLCRNEQGKRCLFARHWKLLKFAEIGGPTTSHLQFK